MEANRSLITLLAVIAYLALCIGVGLWSLRRTKSTSDFFVAGRTLGMFVTAFAIFSSTMSGFGFVGGPGLMYSMAIGDGPPAENEEVFEVDGFRVYIDKKSLFFLNGSELDYFDGLTGAGFKFRNPNASGTCGCGESFSV